MGGFQEKIDVKTRRNFEFYRRAWEEWGPCCRTFWVAPCPIGRTALQAFSKQDNEGGGPYPCSEAPLLKKVLGGKATVNLFISMWAGGVADGLFLLKEVQDDYPWCPAWVWKAVMSQVHQTRCLRRKRRKEEIEEARAFHEREFTQLDWVLQATGPSWRWDIVKGPPSKPRDEDLFLIEVV